jgi:heme-degrading monooxygenase HmoA
MTELDTEDHVPMLTFSIGKNEDDEVVVSVDWADEFDLLEWTEQQSFLLQAMDRIDETLAYVEDSMEEEEFSEDDEDEDDDGDEPDEAA